MYVCMHICVYVKTKMTKPLDQKEQNIRVCTGLTGMVSSKTNLGCHHPHSRKKKKRKKRSKPLKHSPPKQENP